MYVGNSVIKFGSKVSGIHIGPRGNENDENISSIYINIWEQFMKETKQLTNNKKIGQ